MTKKHVKAILCILQAALIALLFLPAAYPAGSNGGLRLTAFDLAHRYAAVSNATDSSVYLFFSLCCPLVSLLSLFLLHERANFGLGACLSAMELLVQACFYTAVKTSMAGSAALTGLYPFFLFLALLAMGLEIYGYLLVGPGKDKNGGK